VGVIRTVGADFYFDLVTALWLGFTGACVGSFLNVVAYRLPLGMSVVWKPSHCPHCSHPIRARDNVPVLGWMILRGKCRDCGQPISPRYAVVEAMLGLVFFLLAYVELFSAGANLPTGPLTDLSGAIHVVWYPNWPVIGIYLYHCLLMCLLTAMVLFDLDRNPVPRGFAWFTVAVIGTCSAFFPFFYPDRHWFVGEPWLAALSDAGSGAAILSCFGFVVWGFVRFAAKRSGDSNAVRYSFALAFAGLTAGGFLGRLAGIALLLLWAVGMLLTRVINKFAGDSRISILPSLWLATFLLLLFWRSLVVALSLQ
jgi:prepilin signal peptidase PulO-like enzyme (type II secretory pathway)